MFIDSLRFASSFLLFFGIIEYKTLLSTILFKKISTLSRSNAAIFKL